MSTDREKAGKPPRYEVGEFEHLEELFDRAVEGVAQELEAPLAAAFRRELDDAVASEWIAKARKALDHLIEPGSAAADLARLDAEDATLLRQFKEALSSTQRPDEAALREEVVSTCNVLSQVVVGRWFHALARARQADEAVALNAQMLPGDQNFADVLRGVDFGAYGVEEAEVLAALRRYRDSLEESFYAGFGPIAFGTHLFVVPTRSDESRPFALFDSGDRAQERAAKERRWVQLVERDKLRKRIEETYGKAVAAISNALTGRPMQPAPAMMGVVVAAMSAGITAGRPGLLQGAAGSSRLQFGDDNFAQPVEFGADLFASVWHHGASAAVEPLCSSRERILMELKQYSEEAHVPEAAAVDMYAHAVAIRAVVPKFGFERYNVEFQRDIEACVVDTYNVSGNTAERLTCDAFAGLLSYRRRDDVF